MALSRIEGDLVVTGDLSANTMNIPALTIVDADVSASAAISASKTQTYITKYYAQADGTDVAAAIVPIHLVRGAGAACVLLSFDVTCIDAPSGGDKTFTVDLKVGNTGDPGGTSVLSAARTYPNATADGTVLEATITDATHDHDDYFIVVVAVSGSTGVQGQGLLCELRMTETFPA